MSINRVVISGNLTRDPDLRSTQSGMSVLGIGVAVNDRRKNPVSGEWEDCPNFVDCIMFGARAAAVAEHLAKGAKVVIEGKLRWSQWERDGQRRSKLEVVIDDIEFMSSRKTGEAPRSTPDQTSALAPQVVMPAPVPNPSPAQPVIDPYGSVYDDDIPF